MEHVPLNISAHTKELHDTSVSPPRSDLLLRPFLTV